MALLRMQEQRQGRRRAFAAVCVLSCAAAEAEGLIPLRSTATENDNGHKNTHSLARADTF